MIPSPHAADGGKRFHVHVGVADLAANLRYYSALFGREPSVVKPDYAKWMLDDPRLNFAISTRSGAKGVDHLGLQVGSEAELAEQRERLKAAELSVEVEGETTCCYARSDKHWSNDPQGLAWETFRTLAEAPTYHAEPSASACCAPAAAEAVIVAPSPAPKIGDNCCTPGGGCC